MNKNNFCTIYLVRHGESEGNVKEIVQGHMDFPITEKGEKQVLKTADIFKDIHFDAIYSSDLLRAKQTAEIIKLGRDLKIKTSELLRERKLGEFEGETSDYYYKTLKDELSELDTLSKKERLGYKLHPTIESDGEVINRFVTYIKEIAIAHRGENVLITTHGGPIKLLLLYIGWFTPEDVGNGTLRNAGYAVVKSDGVDFFVKEVVGFEKR
jgi:broad specificity phosphatase PhoE